LDFRRKAKHRPSFVVGIERAGKKEEERALCQSFHREGKRKGTRTSIPVTGKGRGCVDLYISWGGELTGKKRKGEIFSLIASRKGGGAKQYHFCMWGPGREEGVILKGWSYFCCVSKKRPFLIVMETTNLPRKRGGGPLGKKGLVFSFSGGRRIREEGVSAVTGFASRHRLLRKRGKKAGDASSRAACAGQLRGRHTIPLLQKREEREESPASYIRNTESSLDGGKSPASLGNLRGKG